MSQLSTPAGHAAGSGNGSSLLDRLGRFWRRYPSMTAVAALAIVLVVYARANPNWYSEFNLQTAFGSITPIALVALAQLVVVLIGGIDISLASIVSLANVVFVQIVQEQSAVLALLIALAVGLLCGLANGLASSYLKLPALIVTLATSFVFAAFAVWVQDRPGGLVPFDVMDAVNGRLLPYVPMAAVWLFGVAIVLQLLLRRTTLGRGIYGFGSSVSGVEAAGLRSRTIQISAFVIAGSLAAGAGIFLAASTGTGDPRFGVPYLLLGVTAVAIGGASFAGGAGTVLGTLAGSAVLGLIGSVLYFVRIMDAWQWVIGAVIIVASVAFQQFITRAGRRTQP
jgi:ribose transport system permease protein